MSSDKGGGEKLATTRRQVHGQSDVLAAGRMLPTIVVLLSHRALNVY